MRETIENKLTFLFHGCKSFDEYNCFVLKNYSLGLFAVSTFWIQISINVYILFLVSYSSVGKSIMCRSFNEVYGRVVIVEKTMV